MSLVAYACNHGAWEAETRGPKGSMVSLSQLRLLSQNCLRKTTAGRECVWGGGGAGDSLCSSVVEHLLSTYNWCRLQHTLYPSPAHPLPKRRLLLTLSRSSTLWPLCCFCLPLPDAFFLLLVIFWLHVFLVLPLPMQSPLGLLEDFTASPSSLGECVLQLFPCACSLYRLSDRKHTHGLKNYTDAPKSVSSELACLVNFLSIYTFPLHLGVQMASQIEHHLP